MDLWRKKGSQRPVRQSVLISNNCVTGSCAPSIHCHRSLAEHVFCARIHVGIASLQKNIFERACPLKTKKAITVENYEPIREIFFF